MERTARRRRLKCVWRGRKNERDKDREDNRRRKQEEEAATQAAERKDETGEGEQGGGEDNPVRARWNENAVTRNKRGGDPKLLVEVQPEGLGMSLRRGGDETLP